MYGVVNQLNYAQFQVKFIISLKSHMLGCCNIYSIYVCGTGFE